jgi:hypothetical protein
MLNQLKNQLLETFTNNGISLDLIRAEEESGIFIIRVGDTSLKFMINDTDADFYSFDYSYTRFRPGYPIISSNRNELFSILLMSFEVWVKNDVRNILKEIDAPNLWEQHVSLFDAIPSPAPPEDDGEHFTSGEKNQIIDSVEEFRNLIEENFQPLEEQLKDINERLDYLSTAVDRLSRFDWRALALTTAWDIGVLIGLDHDGLRKLSELMLQGFTNVIGLIT